MAKVKDDVSKEEAAALGKAFDAANAAMMKAGKAAKAGKKTATKPKKK